MKGKRVNQLGLIPSEKSTPDMFSRFACLNPFSALAQSGVPACQFVAPPSGSGGAAVGLRGELRRGRRVRTTRRLKNRKKHVQAQLEEVNLLKKDEQGKVVKTKECGRSSRPPEGELPVPRPDRSGESRVGEILSETIKKEKEYSFGSASLWGILEPGDVELEECTQGKRNSGYALSAVRHLKRFRGLRTLKGQTVPTTVDCFSLKSAVRQCFPRYLPELGELSIKTAAKIVRRPCKFCSSQMDGLVDTWERELFEAKVEPLSEREVTMLTRALRMNVPQGWDKRKGDAYIPNGHATSSHSRCEGGNWNEEGFSQAAEPGAVFSSGKPRIVTMYSSYNTETLTPLHNALYRSLKRKGWLLVGDPTPDKVRQLNGEGPYMSFDFKKATDRIKSEVTRLAIAVLKEKAERLTFEEQACLDVLGELRLEEDGPVAPRGQPMGSVMSFPLLCLLNKTVVDLALWDLCEKKEISFKEWTSHRCLINGDDLLLRSPTPNSALYSESHVKWGSIVGFEVNTEKTMVDEEKGEINSTLFVNGELKKKTNLAALYMARETADVARCAWQATTSVKEFRRVMRLNAKLLASQEVKFPSWIPWHLKLSLFGDAKIRRALKAQPGSTRPAVRNLFPVVTRPAGYDLSLEEESVAIRAEVARKRESKAYLGRWRDFEGYKRKPLVWDAKPLSACYAPPRKDQDEKVLSACARHWENKRKAALVEADPPPVGVKLIVSDLPLGFALVDTIRAWRQGRVKDNLAASSGDEIVGNDDFVPLEVGLPEQASSDHG